MMERLASNALACHSGCGPCKSSRSSPKPQPQQTLHRSTRSRRGSPIGSPARSRQSAVAAAASLHGMLAFAEPICFTQQCQADKDALFSLVLTVPVVVLAGFLGYLLSQKGRLKEELEKGQAFEVDSGTVFEVAEGAVPERDRWGQPAMKAVSYTPWPVEEGAEGERVRIEVGPVGSTALRTYVFQKVRWAAGDLMVPVSGAGGSREVVDQGPSTPPRNHPSAALGAGSGKIGAPAGHSVGGGRQEGAHLCGRAAAR